MEQGARNKGQGTSPKKQYTRNKVQSRRYNYLQQGDAMDIKNSSKILTTCTLYLVPCTFLLSQIDISVVPDIQSPGLPLKTRITSNDRSF